MRTDIARRAADRSNSEMERQTSATTQVDPETEFDELETAAPRVGIIMGSKSDMEEMEKAGKILEEAEIRHEIKVMSAHRDPDMVAAYCRTARSRGLRVIIAGAGGAAHLPGMLAAKTIVPVLGVPVPSKYLRGEDSLLSTVQMPPGVPVAAGADNARNAGHLALHASSAPEPTLWPSAPKFRVLARLSGRRAPP
jgi:phosphoribosylaminoimidazole carboxylase PurE protein